MPSEIVLAMRNITKTFPGVQALSHVDFTLRTGEIHALMGENGAGKSTLIKVLTGVEEFESGEISLLGVTGTLITPPRKPRPMGSVPYIRKSIYAPIYRWRKTCSLAGNPNEPA